MTSLAQLAVAATFGISGLYGLQDPAECTTPTDASWGTVESVREVPLMRDINAFDPEVLEHKVAPASAEQLVVRLDAGPVVIFTERQSHGVHARQRVIVRLSDSNALVQSQACSVPVTGWPWSIAGSAPGAHFHSVMASNVRYGEAASNAPELMVGDIAG